MGVRVGKRGGRRSRKERESYSSDTGFSNKFQLFLDKINFSHVWVNQVTFSKVRLLNAGMLAHNCYFSPECANIINNYLYAANSLSMAH